MGAGQPEGLPSPAVTSKGAEGRLAGSTPSRPRPGVGPWAGDAAAAVAVVHTAEGPPSPPW